ncbi:MAG: phosphotransferase [Firmicutes bacterium]|nr:phosphotransferase [Bacillota bacterium]
MVQHKFVSKKYIDKGWSDDQKYCVTDAEGSRFLLRISPMEQYDKKKSEYELMCQVAALGVPMCMPLEFGTSDEGVYSIQSWIDGMDVEELIDSLTTDEQYAYGCEAGRILKAIHSIPAPEAMEDWEIYFNRKADHKIRMYEQCPIQYENGQALIDYINDHRHLLHGRPRTYQHGDYHIGNMMIGTDKKLYIIDFNRNDFGDPWEEFNRIVWCAQAAPQFATGMVNGYFCDDVPMEFWELLALYISSNTLSSVPWAIPFGEKEVQVMVEQANDVLRWYDYMKNPVPIWYKGVKKRGSAT